MTLLLEKKANVDIQGKRGYTALMLAIQYNNIDIVKLLLEKQANVNIQGDRGYTALMLAIDNKYMIVKLLLEKSANVDIENISGYTALTLAVDNKYIEIVKLLLDNTVNKSGQTALTAFMFALQTNNTEIVTLFLQKGVDIGLILNYLLKNKNIEIEIEEKKTWRGFIKTNIIKYNIITKKILKQMFTEQINGKLSLKKYVDKYSKSLINKKNLEHINHKLIIEDILKS